MPDTPENQAAYPQTVVQQEGIGFSLLGRRDVHGTDSAG